MRRSRARLLDLLVVVPMLVLMVGPVEATFIHSPRMWWDLDNDGNFNEPSEGDRGFNLLGGGWGSSKAARARDAAHEWLTETSWDISAELPNIVTVSGVYVDREGCDPGFSQGPAVTCTIKTVRSSGGSTWWDISDSDIFMAPSAPWYAGTGSTPSGDYDFWGILTHEFGHGGGLVHPGSACSSPYPTMCSPAQGAPADGQHARSLQAGDISDMNSQY